jgi:hypothetical protein
MFSALALAVMAATAAAQASFSITTPVSTPSAHTRKVAC